MKRIYFLVPSAATARRIVGELRDARIDEEHIHVMGKEGRPVEDLPQAGLFEASDVVPAVQRGVLLGGLTGLLAGLVVVAFPPARLALGAGAVAALAVIGSGFGAWFSGMIGADVPSPRLKRFRKALQRGELLMLVDVPDERVDEVERLVRAHHRSARIEGVEPAQARLAWHGVDERLAARAGRSGPRARAPERR